MKYTNKNLIEFIRSRDSFCQDTSTIKVIDKITYFDKEDGRPYLFIDYKYVCDGIECGVNNMCYIKDINDYLMKKRIEKINKIKNLINV